MSNAQRFTFGYFELSSGFHIVAIVVGLFAVSDVLFQVRGGGLLKAPTVPRVRISLFSLVLLFKHPVNLVRSSAIGTFFGSLPGAGGAISAFSSYAVPRHRPARKSAMAKARKAGSSRPKPPTMPPPEAH